MRRRAALAALAVVAASATYLTPPGVFAGHDYIQFHSLDQQYWVEAVRELRLPLWNPHVGLGRPFAADIQTSTFYPATLLFLLGPRLGLAASVLIHLLLAAAGMRLLGRRLGLSPPLADAAAVVTVFIGPLAGQFLVGHLGIAEGYCYLPLAFALVLALQDAPSRRGVALLAVTLALQLMSGHPQVGWTTWLVIVLFLAGRRLHGLPAGWIVLLLRDLALFAVALAWAFGMAAIVLLPFAELVAESNRATDELAFASSFAFSLRMLGSLFLAPDLRLAGAFGPERTFFPGVVVALGGLGAVLTIRTREVTGFAVVLVGCLLLALGDLTPAFALAYHVLPGLSRFRVPLRFVLPVPFVLVTLAGLFLSERRLAALHRRGLVAVAAVAAGLAGWLWFGIPRESWSDAVGLSARIGLLLAGCALLLAWTPKPEWRARLAAAMAVVVALDIGLALHAWRGAFPLQVPTGEAVLAEVLSGPELPREAEAPVRILVPYKVARYNAGMRLGYSTPAAYVAPSLDRVWIHIHRVLGIDPPLNNTFPSARIFDRPLPYEGMALVLGYDPARAQLVRRTSPDPRAYAVSCVERVLTWPEAVERIATGHDVHGCALVEPAYARSVLEPLVTGAVRLVSFAPERVVVRSESEGPTLLVLAEPWYPGWRARVGGRDVPTLPVNAWMRAAVVPAGAHDVVFSYESRPLAAGATLSLLSLAGFAVALAPRRGTGSAAAASREGAA